VIAGWTAIVFAWRRLTRQPAWRVALFLEALSWLVVARFLLRVMTFRKLAALLDWAFRGHFGSASTRERRTNIRWAIRTAAGFLPGKTVCFPKGIAAHIMCRLRGIPTSMLYGAGIVEGGRLKAHVWIQDGTNGVVGHNLAEGYRVIAEFPARG